MIVPLLQRNAIFPLKKKLNCINAMRLIIAFKSINRECTLCAILAEDGGTIREGGLTEGVLYIIPTIEVCVSFK